jgi:nitrogen fixation protein NifX
LQTPQAKLRRLRLLSMSTESAATLTVAFATGDRRHVDQHFGAAHAFATYSVGVDSAAMREVVQFLEAPQDSNEGKLAAKIALLEGCAAVYCAAVGASAIRQLLAQGIQPIKVSEGARIDDLIAQLQGDWLAGPSGWLAKAIRGRGDESRFAAMAAEGWRE